MSSVLNETRLAQSLATWIVDQSEPSTAVVDRAADVILDTLGCIVVGKTLPETDILAAALSRSGDPATFLGYSASVADADDTHTPTVLHLASVVVPTLLALSYEHVISGSTAARAIAAGYEIGIRLATFEHYEHGWHSTGTFGALAAAAAAASALGLSQSHTTTALCISASMAAGLRANFGSATRSLHAGRAAAAGYLAGRLAQRGFSAQLAALDGEAGFVETLGGVNTKPRLAGPGEELAVFEATFKPFASGIVTHAIFDAAIALRAQLRDSSELSAIIVTVAPIATQLAHFREPANGMEAKLSLSHCVAVGLHFGSGSPAYFLDAALDDPELCRLRRLCEIRTDPELSRVQARLELQMANGTMIQTRIDCARGGIDNPLDREALTKKFNEFACPMMSVTVANELISKTHELRSLSNLNTLAMGIAI